MFYLPPRSKEVVPVLTDGPLSVASMPWRFTPNRDALVVIAKASLKLVPGKTAYLLAEPQFLTGDEHLNDSEDLSLVYSNDLVPLKPRVDLWLTGHAYPAPGASSSWVRFSFGSFQRQLAIIGDRHWSAASISAPAQLKPLRICYEYAFGGPEYAANPIGLGYIPGGGALRLPNLEDPKQLIKSPADRPAPASFGPIPTSWPSRQRHLGSYDDAWLKSHWPYFPKDFDYAYFNAAPEPQQLAEARGDESFSLEGVSPEHPKLTGKLPNLTARAFAQFTEEHGYQFRELQLKLDTIAFNSDELTVQLVWRGLIEVSSDLAPELGLIYITLDDRAQPLELLHARERFARLLNGAQAQPEEALGLEFGLMSPEQEQAARDESVRLGEPLPLEHTPPKNSKPPNAPTLSRTAIEALLAQGESLAGIDFSSCDLSGLDLSKRDLSGALFNGACLKLTSFSDSLLEYASFVFADCDQTNFSKAQLGSANFSEATIVTTSFEEAQLRYASFNAAHGQNISFKGAVLEAANFAESRFGQISFERAHLASADFSSAELSSANFSHANLTDALFYEADLSGAQLSHANLTQLRADQANLSSSSLSHVNGSGASFVETKLNGSQLQHAQLEEALFNHADLSDANLSRANLKSARLRYAILARAVAPGANLMEANLERADLSDADLRGSNLHASETLNAKFHNTRLEQAILTQTKLVHPILKHRT